MKNKHIFINIILTTLVVAVFAITACKSDGAASAGPDQKILSEKKPGSEWFCQKSALRSCERSQETCGDQCEKTTKAFCFTFSANGADQANCFATESACKDIQGNASSHDAKNVSSCGMVGN